MKHLAKTFTKRPGIYGTRVNCLRCDGWTVSAAQMPAAAQ